MRAVTVSLSDVVEQMDMASDEVTSYVNRKTGKLITLTPEDLALADDAESAAQAPKWQKDLLPKVREVLESGDFISLPSQFDIHDWSIMDRFTRSLTDDAKRRQRHAALHGRGAFRLSFIAAGGKEAAERKQRLVVAAGV